MILKAVPPSIPTHYDNRLPAVAEVLPVSEFVLSEHALFPRPAGESAPGPELLFGTGRRVSVAGVERHARHSWMSLRDFCKERDIDLRIAIFPFLHNLGPDYPFDARARADRRILPRDGYAVPRFETGPAASRRRRPDGEPLRRAPERARRMALAAEALERDLLADLFDRQP